MLTDAFQEFFDKMAKHGVSISVIKFASFEDREKVAWVLAKEHSLIYKRDKVFTYTIHGVQLDYE